MDLDMEVWQNRRICVLYDAMIMNAWMIWSVLALICVFIVNKVLYKIVFGLFIWSLQVTIWSQTVPQWLAPIWSGVGSGGGVTVAASMLEQGQMFARLPDFRAPHLKNITFTTLGYQGPPWLFSASFNPHKYKPDRRTLIITKNSRQNLFEKYRKSK